MLTSDMSDAAKSLLTDIADTIMRKGTEPDYDKIVVRMEAGSNGGYSEPASMDDFELDGIVAGAEHSHEPEDEDTDRGEELPEVAGPCCASCGLTGASCGKPKGPVPDYFLFGPTAGADFFGDDSEKEPDLFFDPHGDDANWLVSGPDDGSCFAG